MTSRVKLSELNLEKVKINPLKEKTYTNGQTSKSCTVTYNDGSKILIQTVKNKVPFGLTIGQMDENEKKLVEEGKKWPKYSLEINIEGDEKNKIKEFDKIAAKFISDNSNSWWKKHLNPDQVLEHDYYVSMIKVNKEGDYPDRFKIKLPFSQGKPLFKVYDENNQKVELFNSNGTVDWSWIKPQMHVETISEIECIWEVNKKCYCTVKALQLRIFPPSTLKECAFDDEETISEPKETISEPKETNSTPKETNSTINSASKEESEEEESEEEEDLMVDED